MTTWILEPGHTELAFSARHMMVTIVRGAFKEVHGRMEFDWDSCLETTFEGWTDATRLWTGEPTRDEHLRSADFFDVENHPTLTFSGRFVERLGDTHFTALTELTIRGTRREIPLDVGFQGQWRTPWWEGDVNRGEMHRMGWLAKTRINRHDFGVSWQDELPGGGRVVGDEIDVVIDAEAIKLDDLERTGAISYYGGKGDLRTEPGSVN